MSLISDGNNLCSLILDRWETLPLQISLLFAIAQKKRILRRAHDKLYLVYPSSGFILMVKLFSGGGSKIIVALIVMVVTVSFGFIALADGLLLVKVR